MKREVKPEPGHGCTFHLIDTGYEDDSGYSDEAPPVPDPEGGGT